MLIIGADYHPSFQQVAFVDDETGECGERKLTHKAEAESFYRNVQSRKVRVGMEATGHARWFERFLCARQRRRCWPMQFFSGSRWALALLFTNDRVQFT